MEYPLAVILIFLSVEVSVELIKLSFEVSLLCRKNKLLIVLSSVLKELETCDRGLQMELQVIKLSHSSLENLQIDFPFNDSPTTK